MLYLKVLGGLFLTWVGLASAVYFPIIGLHFDAFGLMLALVFSTFCIMLVWSYVGNSEGKSNK